MTCAWCGEQGHEEIGVELSCGCTVERCGVPVAGEFCSDCSGAEFKRESDRSSAEDAYDRYWDMRVDAERDEAIR